MTGKDVCIFYIIYVGKEIRVFVVAPGIAVALLPLELKGLPLELCTSVTHLKPTSGPWHSNWDLLIVLQQLAVFIMNARSQPQQTSPALITDLSWKGTQRPRNLSFLFTDEETEALG